MHVIRWLAPLLVICHCTVANAAESTSARSLSLGDIAGTAELRLAEETEDAGPPDFQSSSWLAALPSIGISYLGSDESDGTDETEVSLNLPLKSPFGREQDRTLETLAESLASTEQNRRRLYVSGLIREALWSERIERTRLQFAERKIELLEQLVARQQTLFEARTASRYSLLIVQQELAKAKLAKNDQQRALAQWRQRYRQLTGMGHLPEVIDEPAPPADNPWRNHPELQLLDLSWQQQRARIRATSARAAPWNLSLNALNLDNPQLEENQYGLALEVPLSVFDTSAESSLSEWQQGAREFSRQRDELQLALDGSWQRLKQEATYLAQRQALLDEAQAIGKQLIGESRALLSQNEIGSEIWIRRLLESLDTEEEAALNTVLIGQNRAMSRQAAGVPL